MSSLSNAQLTALQAQPTLQSGDFLRICQLAEMEGMSEPVESFSFEEFLGFTLHLFVTTELPQTRIHISQLLPKFGSRIVLPLLKVVHHFQHVHVPIGNVRTLALQSLGNMAPPALIIGLKGVLQQECLNDLMPIILSILMRLTHQKGRERVFSLLTQFLPETTQVSLASLLCQCLSRVESETDFESEAFFPISVVSESSLSTDESKRFGRSDASSGYRHRESPALNRH